MAYPRNHYRDPMEVAMRSQAVRCKGCRHEHPLPLLGQTIMACTLGKRHSENGGKRCRNYKEQKHAI